MDLSVLCQKFNASVTCYHSRRVNVRLCVPWVINLLANWEWAAYSRTALRHATLEIMRLKCHPIGHLLVLPVARLLSTSLPLSDVQQEVSITMAILLIGQVSLSARSIRLPWVALPFYDMQQEPEMAKTPPLIGSHFFLSDLLILRLASPFSDIQQATKIAKALRFIRRTLPSVLVVNS